MNLNSGPERQLSVASWRLLALKCMRAADSFTADDLAAAGKVSLSNAQRGIALLGDASVIEPAGVDRWRVTAETINLGVLR